MRSPVLCRFALLVAGLGLSVGLAAAGPNDKKGPLPPPKATPKVSAPRPGLTPPPPPKAQPKGPVVLPKADPKPLPKFEARPPASLPKAGPRPLPKFEPKRPVSLPKADPKPLPPRVAPKPGSVPLPPVSKVKPTSPVVPPETKGPVVRPGVKGPGKAGPRPILVHKRPKAGGPAVMPKGPGLKLPGGTKIDHAELAKIRPPVDLTKTKPEKVLAARPPADFKVKPIALDKIHVPGDAPQVEKLGLGTVQANQAFVVNKSFYAGGDYHLKFGTKVASGYYCYPGKHHCHWHHCVWDPCFGCHYYYCPSASCYYYWCATDYCYHPCHWFVDYGTCYYPWWICGGFGGYGYVATPHISIFVGW